MVYILPPNPHRISFNIHRKITYTNFMKYLLIIFLLLSPSVGWSKDINSDDLVERDGLYYEKFNNDPFTGNVVGIKQGKISYISGQLRSNLNYKDGSKDGESLYYNENGKLVITDIWKNGELMKRINH